METVAEGRIFLGRVSWNYIPTGLPPSHFVNLTETTSRFTASAFRSGFKHFLTTLAAMLEYCT